MKTETGKENVDLRKEKKRRKGNTSWKKKLKGKRGGNGKKSKSMASK